MPKGRSPFHWIKTQFSIEKASSLNELRSNILTIGFIIIVATCLIFLPFRLINFDTQRLPILLIYSAVSIFGLYLIRFKKVRLARLIMASLFYVGFSILIVIGWSSIQFYLVAISLFSISMVFLRFNNKYIWLEYAIGLGLLLTALITNQMEWLDITLTVVAFNVFFFMVHRLITNLEKRLTTEITKSSKLNEDLKKRNDQSELNRNIMAHDIKAPLRSIKGFSQLIKSKMVKLDMQDSDIESHFNYIIKSIDSLENLISDLLIQSKAEQGRLDIEPINLHELVHEQLNKVRFQIIESNIDVVTNNLKTIHADRKGMVILFNNLISNAVKYQPKGEGHLPKIQIEQKDFSEKTQISIADNGIGIESKYLKDTFTPFVRVHDESVYEGTGLGLSICKSIVEAHQGKISVNSEKGIGSTFTITIPKYPHQRVSLNKSMET